MKRTASANWKGSGKEGKGLLGTQSGVLNNTPYSYHTRFEDGAGTNPEELIAAAHSGCFTMKLSFNLSGAGFIPDSIDTRCEITLENGAVTLSHLSVTAKVPNISQQQFDELTADAAKNCPISKLLSCEITHEASLES